MKDAAALDRMSKGDQLDPEEITETLKHKYGCQCFLCIATYGNPLEDGDDDGPGPF